MKLKIVSVVGARPEFVQAQPLSRALRTRHEEVLVHTGQHYDHRMSDTFFNELSIAAPYWNLEVGSGSHARQTAAMLERFEDVVLAERPDLVIVRGDTNSTLACALAARKQAIPIAHVEAGERSYAGDQPEEINRVVVDHLSTLHYCVSRRAVDQLAAEGLTRSVQWVGDVMLDAILHARPLADARSRVLETLSVKPGQYALVTVHRAENTSDPRRLEAIISALNQLDERIVFPVHPRTRHIIDELGISLASHVTAIEPVGYLDMLMLEQHARLIATDSGGVQREAYYLGIPCLTLRDETEWVETVEVGWNRLVGSDLELIARHWWPSAMPADRPPIYGDGRAAETIVDGIEAAFAAGNLRR